MENKINIDVNYGKQILSSETKIYKTESFFYQTKKIAGIDVFVLKIAESIQGKYDEILKLSKKNDNCFFVKTIDGKFSFLFRFGKEVESEIGLSEKDIVFFALGDDYDNVKLNDQRISTYLRQSKLFSVSVEPTKKTLDESIFKKIYLISYSEYINFPMLSKKQRELVKIEDKNVLVQGVAGSGKTNICISKIIYTACQNYSGKVLYTTF